jgi:hypothetical protein
MSTGSRGEYSCFLVDLDSTEGCPLFLDYRCVAHLSFFFLVYCFFCNDPQCLLLSFFLFLFFSCVTGSVFLGVFGLFFFIFLLWLLWGILCLEMGTMGNLDKEQLEIGDVLIDLIE